MIVNRKSPIQNPGRRSEPPFSGKSKILVVEDNPLNMELAVDLLELAGYAVLQAATAEEGLELARAEKPALILMDMQLPGLDGLAAARALKADPATRDIPIVALTAYAMRGDAEKMYQAGCAGYIAKPIDTRQFAQTVAQFLP